MDRRTLNRVAKNAGVSVQIRTTNGKTRQVYLLKWIKTPNSAPGRGVTRSVFLCPESQIADLDEATMRAKIDELLARLAELARSNND